MDILSTTITQLNLLIAETGLFSKLYGLCQLERDSTGKATQKIIEYQSNGQGNPITDYDSENGTLAWLMRSAIGITVAPAINKVTSNDEVITITFPLRAIAVVSKEQLACDNSTAADQIAQTLIKKLQGQNVAIKSLIKARSFRVESASYTTNVKEVAKNYNWATLQMDFNVVIITSKECLPDVCGTSSTSPCAFSIDLINSDGVLIFELTEVSNNPFTLPDQPIIDGNGNAINVAYDPDNPFVTEACSVICADATVNVNGGLFDTVASGGTLNVPVEYENGTPVGTISGGVVEIPNPITCADATAVLKNSLNTTLSTTNIASGVSADINAPDATAVLKDTSGNILDTEVIPSNVSEDIIAPDGTVTVVNSNLVQVDSGVVLSGGSLQLDAPDGSVTINSVAFDTVPSDGSLDIEVRQESGSTQVGGKQGQFWRIDNSDISINSTPFDSVAAEDSLNIPVKDTNGTSVGSEVGGEWIVPAFEQDLVTRVNFDSGSALEYELEVDSDTAGTYTTASFGGSVTTATYEKNSVAASLPITVVATDTLKIIPDSDDGFVKLTGTY